MSNPYYYTFYNLRLLSNKISGICKENRKTPGLVEVEEIVKQMQKLIENTSVIGKNTEKGKGGTVSV